MTINFYCVYSRYKLIKQGARKMMTEHEARDMLLSIDTKVRYDNLFHWFENKKFKNDGNYPRTTNLVLEFSAWLDTLDDYDLAEELGLFADFNDEDDALKAARQAREEITRGIDNWLEK